MQPSDITAAHKHTIHRPDAVRHFMRFKPVHGVVTIRRGERVLARSQAAMRLTEIGHDIYDPVFYIPRADIVAGLSPVPDRSTHCPLKGDASYFADIDGTTVAWTYDSPLEFSKMLDGYIAFYPNLVTVEERGAEAS